MAMSQSLGSMKNHPVCWPMIVIDMRLKWSFVKLNNSISGTRIKRCRSSTIRARQDYWRSWARASDRWLTNHPVCFDILQFFLVQIGLKTPDRQTDRHPSTNSPKVLLQDVICTELSVLLLTTFQDTLHLLRISPSRHTETTFSDGTFIVTIHKPTLLMKIGERPHPLRPRKKPACARGYVGNTPTPLGHRRHKRGRSCVRRKFARGSKLLRLLLCCCSSRRLLRMPPSPATLFRRGSNSRSRFFITSYFPAFHTGEDAVIFILGLHLAGIGWEAVRVTLGSVICKLFDAFGDVGEHLGDGVSLWPALGTV